jgi:hypothetical protein
MTLLMTNRVVAEEPDVDPALRAFYYAKVFEIPMLRWAGKRLHLAHLVHTMRPDAAGERP